MPLAPEYPHLHGRLQLEREGLLDPELRGDAQAKQGWLCCLDDGVDLHSVGFPDASGRFAVAILSRQPLGYPAARQVLDDVAAAVRGPLA